MAILTREFVSEAIRFFREKNPPKMVGEYGYLGEEPRCCAIGWLGVLSLWPDANANAIERHKWLWTCSRIADELASPTLRLDQISDNSLGWGETIEHLEKLLTTL